MIARGVMATYIALPNTLAHYATKDRLAQCFTAALNRVLLGQKPDGQLPQMRGDGEFDYNITQHAVVLQADGFVRAPFRLEDHTAASQMDFLVACFEELAVTPAALAAHGYAHVMLRPTPAVRLEFETAAAGRYARFLVWLQGRSPQVRRRLHVAGEPRPLPAPQGDGAARRLPAEPAASRP